VSVSDRTCRKVKAAEKHQCNHQAVTVREGQEDEQHGERAAAVSKIRRGPIRPPRYTVNGPINIRPASKALPIHALSSYPNP